MNNKFIYGSVSLLISTLFVLQAEPLKLSTAYELALKNEPHLRASLLKTEAGSESIMQSKSKLYPRVEGSAAWGRYEYEYTTSTLPTKETYTNYAISAVQPLYHPELFREIDDAKIRQKISEYQYEAQAQQLGLDLAKAYFNFLYIQRNIELIESQKQYYESKFKQLEEMLKMGLSNRIDLLEAKVHRDNATAQWLNEKKLYFVAKLKLEHLTGESFTDVMPFDFTAIDTNKLSVSREEWESKIDNNPALKSALATEESARHQVAIREYEHYPKVDLSLTRKETYTQDTIAHKYDNQAIAQVTLPIYLGGMTQSRIREGKLLVESAQRDLDYYRQETRFHFEELWAGKELTIERLNLLKESEKSAQLYLESVEKGHQAGLKSLVDLLEAKAKIYEIRRQLTDAGYQVVNNYIGLLEVTGELNVEKISEFEKIF
ncbi:MAG: TolC family protein [Sulfuricurvum sp.]|nr:TolC family protein [Sulfuricurvum sp.]